MKLLLQFKYILVISVITTVLFSCSTEDDSVAPGNENQEPTVLVSLDTFLIRPSGELQTFVEAAISGIDPATIKYDAVILKVVYRTKYKGETINASGLVILPSTEDEVDMLSFQHGTIGSDAEAPSNITFTGSGSNFLFGNSRYRNDCSDT